MSWNRKIEYTAGNPGRNETAAAGGLGREGGNPPRGGVAAHHYANPKTGTSLKKGKKIGPWRWEHIDRRTGEVFLGNPAAFETDYDGVQINWVHGHLARNAVTLALAYRLGGEIKYARKARELLLAYAEKYLTYPLTRFGKPETHGNGGARRDCRRGRRAHRGDHRTGPGIGGAENQVPCLLLRRRAAHTVLAWALALDGRPPELAWRGSPTADNASLDVAAPGRPTRTLQIQPGRDRPVVIGP